jgi:hypothetical protein
MKQLPDFLSAGKNFRRQRGGADLVGRSDVKQDFPVGDFAVIGFMKIDLRFLQCPHDRLRGGQIRRSR